MNQVWLTMQICLGSIQEQLCVIYVSPRSINIVHVLSQNLVTLRLEN